MANYSTRDGEGLLALGALVPDCSREDREHVGVLRDSLLVGLGADLRSEVLGEPDQFLGGICHDRDDSTCASEGVLVSALSDKRPREIAVSGGMAKGWWS